MLSQEPLIWVGLSDCPSNCPLPVRGSLEHLEGLGLAGGDQSWESEKQGAGSTVKTR